MIYGLLLVSALALVAAFVGQRVTNRHGIGSATESRSTYKGAPTPAPMPPRDATLLWGWISAEDTDVDAVEATILDHLQAAPPTKPIEMKVHLYQEQDRRVYVALEGATPMAFCTLLSCLHAVDSRLRLADGSVAQLATHAPFDAARGSISTGRIVQVYLPEARFELFGSTPPRVRMGDLPPLVRSLTVTIEGNEDAMGHGWPGYDIEDTTFPGLFDDPQSLGSVRAYARWTAAAAIRLDARRHAGGPALRRLSNLLTAFTDAIDNDETADAALSVIDAARAMLESRPGDGDACRVYLVSSLADLRIDVPPDTLEALPDALVAGFLTLREAGETPPTSFDPAHPYVHALLIEAHALLDGNDPRGPIVRHMAALLNQVLVALEGPADVDAFFMVLDRMQDDVRAAYLPLEQVARRLVGAKNQMKLTSEDLPWGELVQVEESLRALDEATWNAPTMNDRITAAFQVLEEQGILAIENCGNTDEDGWNELREVHATDRDEDWGRGGLFFTDLDVRRAVQGLGLTLTFGPLNADQDDEAVISQLAEDIVTALRAHDLPADYPGEPPHKIVIPGFEWKRRRG